MVLLADRLVRLLDITLGKKNSLGIVFEMLAYLVPHYLGLALPAALFLGLLFGFNSLSKNSELDAFMATGIGLHQLVRPVMIIAAFFTILAFLIVGWVQPQARYAFRAIRPFGAKRGDILSGRSRGVHAGRQPGLLFSTNCREKTTSSSASSCSKTKKPEAA